MGSSRVYCFGGRHLFSGGKQPMSLFEFAACLQGLGQSPEALPNLKHDLQVVSRSGGNKLADHLERA
jgi:hypothetical protein